MLEFTASDLPWYIVYTKPLSEQMVAEHLHRQGYRVYAPMVKVHMPSCQNPLGGFEEKLEAMFPRYGFFAPNTYQQPIAPVRFTAGVSNIIRFGNQLAAIAISTLQKISVAETYQHQSGFAVTKEFQVGKPVPMEWLVSQIAEDRVQALLQLLGEEVKVGMHSITQRKLAQ